MFGNGSRFGFVAQGEAFQAWGLIILGILAASTDHPGVARRNQKRSRFIYEPR